MPGGAAAVVPRMPLPAAGPVAAAVLRIPGKGTKIFFVGKIRSRFSAGAGTRTRPFPPGMPEFCRLRVAPGRPIARRGSGSGHTPDARRPTPGSGSGPTPDAVPCNAALLCPAFPLCSAARPGAAAHVRGAADECFFLRFAGENASFWESSEILLPLPRILNRNNNGISITQR